MVEQTIYKSFAHETITKERLKAKKYALFIFYFVFIVLVFVFFYYFVLIVKNIIINGGAIIWVIFIAIVLYKYIKNDIKKLKVYAEKR